MKKSRNAQKKSRKKSRVKVPLTKFAIDIRSLYSLMQGLMSNAALNMLAREGFVLPHFVAVVGSQLRTYPIPIINDEDFELHRQHLPRFLSGLGATMAAVVREGCYRTRPLFVPKSPIPVEDDPNSQTCIFVEAADINSHEFKILPFHRKPDGGYLFEEPTFLDPAFVDKLFLEGVQFKGKKTDESVMRLLTASKEGDFQLVKRLLSSGINVDAQSGNATALMGAAANGHVDLAQELLSHGATIDAASPEGWTPLMLASLQGHLEMVRLLLDRGAAVNAKWSHHGEYGGTALASASSNGFTNVIELLLERGADITVRDEGGVSALSMAATSGHLKAVKLLVEKGARLRDQIDAFTEACAEGQERIAKYFVDYGLDVDAKGDDGLTALMKASLQGHDNMVKVLLELCADPWIKNSEGDTAWDLTENPSIRQALAVAMKAGAQAIQKSSPNSSTPTDVSA
ncbi:MAG: ankyrin repeat domain-containing protein [Desulfomonilaceae bacterium]